MFYFEKLLDSLRSIRLWLTTDTRLILWSENTRVFITVIPGSFVVFMGAFINIPSFCTADQDENTDKS